MNGALVRGIRRFQSTLPRRERLHPRLCSRSITNFNPRSREGSDLAFSASTHQPPISIHAPAKGATAIYQLDFVQLPDFNPRPPRSARGRAPRAGRRVSRLNPTPREGGARQYSNAVYFSSRFQSTLPRRERHLAVVAVPLHNNNFNPRSREGSDEERTYKALRQEVFQSTLPRRERQEPVYMIYRWYEFQSTLPRRERPVHALRLHRGGLRISIHAPAKERQQKITKTIPNDFCKINNYNNSFA